MGNSKNTHKAILRKMGRLYYMAVFGLLIKVMILVCYCLFITNQEFGRPIFLDGIFGRTHMYNNYFPLKINYLLSFLLSGIDWFAKNSWSGHLCSFFGIVFEITFVFSVLSFRVFSVEQCHFFGISFLLPQFDVRSLLLDSFFFSHHCFH